MGVVYQNLGEYEKSLAAHVESLKLERAMELKEIAEKLMKESEQLMEEYEVQRKRGRARKLPVPD